MLNQINCPHCNRFLFEASDDIQGTIAIKCRSKSCQHVEVFVWRGQSPEIEQAAVILCN